MGEVCIARTPWRKQPVAAVKRLRADVARVPTFAERFQHESELAVRLDHGNVVGTLDVGSVNGQLYVASELVLGKDTGIIADRLREREQGGPAAVAVRLLLDVLAGLAYVHEARDIDGAPLALVHRDITPGNVLIGYDGVARLADFGLAKSLLTERANLTQHGEILGTPSYLAPEIIQGQEATVSSDLYGLGAVVYRFLTGVAPYYGTTAEVLYKVVSEDPTPLLALRPDLSPWLASFVHTLLAKDPSRRPSDARGLVAALAAEAQTAGLLVPRSAVGQWLADLFELERLQELEEVDRLIAIASEDLEPQSEGTVVLAARPRSGSLFRALDDIADSLPPELGLAAGTDLSIDAPAPNPKGGTDGGLGAAVPSDVTDAAQVVGTVELDALSTRATIVQPHLFEFEEESGTQQLESAPGDARFQPVPTALDEASSGLPGFIDPRSRPASYGAPGDTNLDHDHLPGGGAPNPVPMVQPVAESKVTGPAGPRADVRRPGGGALARSGAAMQTDGRSLLVLGLMLVVAVLLGVLVGALVVSYRQPTIAVVPSQVTLQEQLFRVQTRLVRQVERGEVVPAEIWSKVTRVHTALRAGDDASAAALLEELDVNE